jgi:hypothetical protein
VCVQITIIKGVNGSSRESLAETNDTETTQASAAARKMINNNKNLPQTAIVRCFSSESSDYERKRESFDGLNAQYD